MFICPNCKRQLDSNFDYCPYCGTAIVHKETVVAICRVCGALLDPVTHQCPACEARRQQRLTEEAKRAEEARLAEEARRAEEARLAEEARRVNAFDPAAARGSQAQIPVNFANPGAGPSVYGGNPTYPNGNGATQEVTFVDPGTVKKPEKKKGLGILLSLIVIALCAAIALGIFAQNNKNVQPPSFTVQRTTERRTEPSTQKPEPTTKKPEPTTKKPEPTTKKPEPTTIPAQKEKTFTVENFHITLTDDFTMKDIDAGDDDTYLKRISNAHVDISVRLRRFGEHGWTASYSAIQFANAFSYGEGTSFEKYISYEGDLLYLIRRYDSPTGGYSKKSLDVYYKARNGFWFLDIVADPDYFDAHLDELKAFARTVTFD